MARSDGKVRFDGKTVVISGGARGQGRAHAVRFAAEGANVVVFDLCAQIDTVPFPMATKEDLDATAEMLRGHGGRSIATVADVRDWTQVRTVFDQAMAEFGSVDVAVANAGIVGRIGKVWEMEDDVFRDVLDVNVVGAWHVIKAAILCMRPAGTKGSIVVTGSGASVKALPNIAHYVASKHALVGLVRSAAREVARDGIRVNLVAPGNVNSPMMQNDAMARLYVPEAQEPTPEAYRERAASGVPMGVPWVEPEDVTEAVLYLASDAARYTTGAILPVDGGSGIT